MVIILNLISINGDKNIKMMQRVKCKKSGEEIKNITPLTFFRQKR